VVALHKDYVTLERLVENREYDIRVQKVGTHLRAYKRMNSNWKGNVGTCVLEEVEVTDLFREWAEECGKLFGGMDILTVVLYHHHFSRRVETIFLWGEGLAKCYALALRTHDDVACVARAGRYPWH
jgi:hypothetical protein